MHKIIYIFILHLFITFSLNAKEPLLAILFGVVSNDTQKFNIGNYNFYCQPYGVLSLEKLSAVSEQNSSCKSSIDGFYKKNPTLKYFSYDLLKIKQTYHIEVKQLSCVIYAKGQNTLSELLLREGLALVKEDFEDEEFSYSFKKAQKSAKFEKKGLWSTEIVDSCMEEISKGSN